MSKKSNSHKQLQLVTILTSILIPIIIVLAIMELYYMLGVAIVIELALIVWTVMLAKSSKKLPHTSSATYSK